MFGLMRPEKSCSNNKNSDYRYHRMHYCGTCKTLGQEYGQRARTLLNFDTVFFAEVLSDISKENLTEWQDGYQAINQCLTMPDQKESIPLSLKYAAATNVLLGELKLDDNIKDTGGLKWKLARRVFSKSFRKANQQFQDWGMDTTNFWTWIENQVELERVPKINFSSLEDLLTHYAEPTAQMTAAIFAHGATVVGNAPESQKMYELGYQFGRLIYTLDAFEDVEKDFNRQEFNPLITFFNPSKALSDWQFEAVRTLILSYQEMIAQELQNLPLSPSEIERYTIRLTANLALRIYKNRPVKNKITTPSKSTQESIADLIKQFRLSTITWARTANYYLASLVVYIFPLAADYGVQTDNWQVYKWMAVFTAFLGLIGLGRYAKAEHKDRKTKRQLKKGKRKLNRLFKRFKNILTKKKDCWEDCLSACCAGCIGACFSELCTSMCDGMEDGKTWPWVVIGGICVAVALIIVFV